MAVDVKKIAGNLINLSDKENEALSKLLAALAPFAPALRRMAKRYRDSFINSLRNKKYSRAYLKLARASKPLELVALPIRAYKLSKTLAEVAKEQRRVRYEILLRVAITALAII